jgi:hypothetical protein
MRRSPVLPSRCSTTSCGVDITSTLVHASDLLYQFWVPTGSLHTLDSVLQGDLDWRGVGMALGGFARFFFLLY